MSLCFVRQNRLTLFKEMKTLSSCPSPRGRRRRAAARPRSSSGESRRALTGTHHSLNQTEGNGKKENIKSCLIPSQSLPSLWCVVRMVMTKNPRCFTSLMNCLQPPHGEMNWSFRSLQRTYEDTKKLGNETPGNVLLLKLRTF